MANLLDLPIELHQIIAAQLPDRDLIHFRASCKTVAAAIDQDGQTFWRRRFLTRFELAAPFRGNDDLGKFYRRWIGTVLSKVPVSIGGSKDSISYVTLMKHLLTVTTPTDMYLKRPTSKNLEFLKQFEVKTNFLQTIFDLRLEKSFRKAEARGTYQAIMITLGSWMFDTFRYEKTFGFENSQKKAYGDPVTEKLVKGKLNQTVNLSWVFHTLNFFKHHLMSTESITLRETFETFPWFETPQMWRQKLGQENLISSLGKTWKGTYSYLEQDEVKRIRLPATHTETDDIYIDKNVDLGIRAFQNMKLEVVEDITKAKRWPPVFEYILKPNKVGPLARKTQPLHHVDASGSSLPNVIRFEGTGFDDEMFYVTGVINPLPPQKGIPGWGRIVMMKYFHTPEGHMDTAGLWAYEGIICPGGQMMIGRWWAPDTTVEESELYSGPFIFWSTDLGYTISEREMSDPAGLVLPGSVTTTKALKMWNSTYNCVNEMAKKDLERYWDTVESILQPEQCAQGSVGPASYMCYCGSEPCCAKKTNAQLLNELAEYEGAIAEAREEELATAATQVAERK